MIIFAPLAALAFPLFTYLFRPHFKKFRIVSSHTSGFWQYSLCPAPSTLTTRQSLVPSFSSCCSNAKPRRSWNIFWFHHVRFHVSTNQMLQHNISSWRGTIQQKQNTEWLTTFFSAPYKYNTGIFAKSKGKDPNDSELLFKISVWKR